MLKLLGAAVISAVCGMLLGELGFRGRKLFGLLCALVILCAISGDAVKIIQDFTSIEGVGELSEIGSVCAKIIGVGYLFGFVCDIASELGETAVASAVSMAGKLEILIIIFPYFRKIVELGLELLQ